MGSDNGATRKAVGDELLAVLPQGGPAWYRQAHLLRLNFVVLSLVMFSSASGYDGSLMNGLQALQQWRDFMDTPTGVWLGFINAIYWAGGGIAYMIMPWVSNNYGRKAGVYIGYLLLIIGVGLVGSDSEAGFILSRFFVGCASACFLSSVPLLMNEIAYPTHRGIVSALFMCGWYVGGTLAAFITFGTRNIEGNMAWRIPSILQILIPAIALPGLIWAPQSPRWLVSLERGGEARAVLEKWHANGDTNSALVNYEVLEITETLMMEKQAHDSASYTEMFKTPGNRHRLFISVSLGIFVQWCGNGVVSYYLALVLDTVGVQSVTDQTLISAFLNVWNLIFSVAAAFSVDRLGRRPLFLLSAGIMLVGFVLVTALSGSFAENGHAATGIAVIPFLFIFFAGYDIAMTPFQIAYPCEIWPYRLRSRGLTVTLITSVVAIFFNTFVNPIALERIGWKYYIVFIVVLILLGLTVYFYYPETRGHTLEQMAVIFDGDDAEVPAATVMAERSRSIVSEKHAIVVSSDHDERL
ncbi:hypothetical protein WHR41_00150 [Cladosporium halotolerans]|uniref:Major facilitator superfamily (MFS) profile domain-containing protein n=1 Tax=Cladosporium halotolerans TaxID=1052096 RepID=A0AB34L0X4_9PEZI